MGYSFSHRIAPNWEKRLRLWEFTDLMMMILNLWSLDFEVRDGHREREREGDIVVDVRL